MLNDQNFEQHWRSDFRMSQDTFQDIVRVVQPALEKRDTQFRRAIPIEKRVEIALWRLSTGNSFCTVTKTFAVGKSTTAQITREFCSEMLHLAPRYIHFPRSRRETAEAIKQFKVFCQCRIPQVPGALDGAHIPIVAPNIDGKADYFSQKQRYTISKGLVGANLVFLDVATGFPGSCHNTCNFRNTSLYKQAKNGEILTKPEVVIENSRVTPLVLGDGAYPLLPWFIKPYNFAPALTRSEKLFNKKLCSARVTVERAFVILKARWRCLLKRLDNCIENVSAVVIACCVLHNICQMNRDYYLDQDGMLDAILAHKRKR